MHHVLVCAIFTKQNYIFPPRRVFQYVTHPAVIKSVTSFLLFPSLVASHHFQILKLCSIASACVRVSMNVWGVCGGNTSSPYIPSGVCFKWESVLTSTLSGWAARDCWPCRRNISQLWTFVLFLLHDPHWTGESALSFLLPIIGVQKHTELK